MDGVTVEGEDVPVTAAGGAPSVPRSRKSWSGPFCVGRHVSFAVNAVQPVPKPLPGFLQAAGFPTTAVRLSQNHWPAGVLSCRACTDTQYVPARRITGAKVMFALAPFVKGLVRRCSTSAPGRFAPVFA